MFTVIDYNTRASFKILVIDFHTMRKLMWPKHRTVVYAFENSQCDWYTWFVINGLKLLPFNDQTITVCGNLERCLSVNCRPKKVEWTVGISADRLKWHQQDFSDGHCWDMDTHNLTSEVYMRSLTAVFSLSVYSCCKVSSVCSHCSDSGRISILFPSYFSPRL